MTKRVITVGAGDNSQTVQYANNYNNGNNILLNGNVNLEVDNTDSATQSGAISDDAPNSSGGITKTGADNLTYVIGTTNTYSGDTVANGGNLYNYSELTQSNVEVTGAGNLFINNGKVDKDGGGFINGASYELLGRAFVAGTDSDFDNSGSVGGDSTTDTADYKGASVTNGGTFENIGSGAFVYGDVSVSEDKSTFNSVGGSVVGTATLSDASTLHIYRGDASATPSAFNQVSGGVTLNDGSTAIIGGSNSNQSLSTNIQSGFTLNDSSNLVFGSNDEVTSQAAIANYVEGDVGAGANSTATIKVLSGGSGGAGNNVVTGDLTLNNESTFAVNTDGTISTGLTSEWQC